MYLSVFGGIIIDLVVMVIFIDDYMVYWGYGVFDMVIIYNG